jgi:hypothetical protein
MGIVVSCLVEVVEVEVDLVTEIHLRTNRRKDLRGRERTRLTNCIQTSKGDSRENTQIHHQNNCPIRSKISI